MLSNLLKLGMLGVAGGLAYNSQYGEVSISEYLGMVTEAYNSSPIAEYVNSFNDTCPCLKNAALGVGAYKIIEAAT